MRRIALPLLAAGLVSLPAVCAHAEGRPSDDEIFGGGSSAKGTATATATKTATKTESATKTDTTTGTGNQTPAGPSTETGTKTEAKTESASGTSTATGTATGTETTSESASGTETVKEIVCGSAPGTGTGTSTASEPATETRIETATETRTETATGSASVTSTGTGPSISPPTGTATETGVDARDELNLGSGSAETRFSADVAPSDPLKIGGQFYWRAISSGKQGQEPQSWSVSAPALVDVYMDARPNDRVRAFVLGRMAYDPTLAQNGSTATSASQNSGSGGGAPAGSVSAQQSDFLGSAFSQTRGPTVLLDQLWLRADIFRTVFVTAGKQHVRWGTARFWAPTDYLHMQPRNPLLPFDARTGTTMLKLHLPWEERGWNFYTYLLPEGPDATRTTGDVAAAARAEVVVGTAEVGLGVFGQRNSKAKFAGDVSFGLWDLDFYGEAALRSAGDVDFVSFRTGVPPANPGSTASIVDAYFPTQRGSGWKPQVTGGVSYTRQYADKDTFTIGAEYFYNGLGYTDPRVYPAVLFLPHGNTLSNPATFFYLGKQYVGVYATAPAPYSWDNTTFTLSTLANITDKSGITRFDYSLIVLTHLRFEAYGAVHWGQRNGEFRFGIDGKALADSNIPQVNNLANSLDIPPALFDVGVGLRVAL